MKVVLTAVKFFFGGGGNLLKARDMQQFAKEVEAVAKKHGENLIMFDACKDDEVFVAEKKEKSVD